MELTLSDLIKAATFVGNPELKKDYDKTRNLINYLVNSFDFVQPDLVAGRGGKQMRFSLPEAQLILIAAYLCQKYRVKPEMTEQVVLDLRTKPSFLDSALHVASSRDSAENLVGYKVPRPEFDVWIIDIGEDGLLKVVNADYSPGVRTGALAEGGILIHVDMIFRRLAKVIKDKE